MHSFFRKHLGVVLLASLVGCTAVVDGELGQLRVDEAAKRSVTVRLRDFSAHVGQQVTVELVAVTRGEDGRVNERQLRSRAILDPLPSNCADIRFFRGAPVVETQIDFWADLNNSRVLDDPPSDHAWRFPVPESGDFLYVHNTDFTFIGSDLPVTVPLGEDLAVNLTGANVHEGRPVTVALVTQNLVDPDNNIFRDSVSGLYRGAAVTGGALNFTFPGIVDAGVVYTIDFTFGDNEEHCIVVQQAPSTSTFTVNVAYTELDCTTPAPVDCAALDASCDRETIGDDCDTLHRQCPLIDCAR